MRTVFADSYYYLALLSRRDAGHRKAVQFSDRYRGQIVTTEWVLAEIADGLSAADKRHGFVALRSQLASDPAVTIVPATTELFQQGCELYEQRTDKDWSLTDCLSFVVMQSLGLTEALTADHHFEQAGFTALLK